MIGFCPVCGSAAHRPVVSLPAVPVSINAQVTPQDAPHVRRGDIDLVVCGHCAHMYNRSFDDGLLDYDASYENTLHYSRRFQEFATGLAQRLVTEHDLAGASVGELGSGPGHFLSMLCDAGAGTGLGWDPSYDAGRLGAPSHADVRISTDRFPDDGSRPVRLALSQHVLEHLHDPVGALVAQRRAVADGGVVYTEVPNGRLMQEHGAVWDLIYEHLSYFVPTSLELACRRAGLRTTSLGSAFDDQFLWCEAVSDGAGNASERASVLPSDPAVVECAVGSAVQFGEEAARRISEARTDLSVLADDGPVVLWGAGSKGMTYLNVVQDATPEAAPVAGVIDVNPRKIGAGVPGTPYTITSPASLTELKPRTVLVANPAYLDEIRDDLTELGLDAEVLPLWE